MDFATEIKTLESLTGDLRKIDQWMALYSPLLKSAWDSRDICQIGQLQLALLDQMEFVFNSWLEQETIIDRLEQKGGMQ